MSCLRQCLLLLFLCVVIINCDVGQIGPDPWDLQQNERLKETNHDINIPPDLRGVPKKIQSGNNPSSGDWFYKRMLAIMLKAGQVKKTEDGSVEVTLQMKFNEDRWQLLDGYTAINSILTDDMIRRSMGYLEESICKPTIVEKVVLAWSDYIQFYLTEYKVHITWTFGILASLCAGMWLWGHISHKHLYILLFMSLYAYEVFTSYKEAEKEELQLFLAAVNSCKWYIWSSQCDLPSPDPLVFIKHMNPLKIGIRMFTTLITEPMLVISETIKILIHGVTDGLWWPVDKIVYGFLIVSINFLLIIFLIMIVFNYILNIPFSFSFLGLLNIGLKQRNRTFNSNVMDTPRSEKDDRISAATLNKLLDVCSRALSTGAQSPQIAPNPSLQSNSFTETRTIRKSASTGRIDSINNNLSKLPKKKKFE